MTSDPLDRHYLTPLFEPQSVAVIGASERPGSIGAVLMENMTAGPFRGQLHAVNPKYRELRGAPCFASVAAAPQRIDLAVVATPAATVPQVIEDCGRAGVRSAVVITAGFREVGPAGEKLERALLENARRHRLRLIGPNCLGLMRPEIGLNATFARGQALAGSLGLVSQSGALCTAMLDWAQPNGVGFSSVVSLGGSSDVDFGEIIDYLANDARTEHILLYIEGIRDARRFMSALRAAARVKPVILMKVGRHPAGSRAAVSHTGALVGADDVFDAAVKRAGVVRVFTIGQLVAAAQALTAHVRPRGNRLAIITNGGGPGVMAADRAADLGLPLAALAPATLAALKDRLPENWSHGNPIDLIGDAPPARYRAALEASLADEGVDGALVMLTPQAITSPADCAQVVAECAQGSSKPVIACFMGEAQMAEARRRLAAARIPVFRTPEPAVEMFHYVSSFYRNQQLLLRTPGPLAEETRPDLDGARLVIENALAERRQVLTEMESKALLAAFRIPIAHAAVARSPQEALLLAQGIGYPVAMKIDSPDVTHKTDVGGVRLNVPNAQAVQSAYEDIVASLKRARPEARVNGVVVEPMVKRAHGRELMVGVVRDRVFGPAITVGLGGVAVEVMADRAVALPPLDAVLAGELLRSTRAWKLLGEFRRMPPASVPALVRVLLRVSEMVCELPWLCEMDINPLVVDETDAIAVDARVLVQAPGATLPAYGHMAIHPYPAQLVSEWTTARGERLVLRPIRPEDAGMEAEFVKGLSPESRYFRFMDTLRELTPQMLVRFTQIDYDREMAFVAVARADGRESQAAVARYVANPDGESCEFAVVVGDAWQGRGLGLRLMSLLIEVARSRGLKTMIGHVLAANRGMLALAGRLGFAQGESPEDPRLRRVTLTLSR